MNLLQNETSPYLLQHANNPVHWNAWNESVFEKAAAENKPILLSIGYSSCHWCHVMEHESFEDEEVANIMNTNFINIKLDREEYPDIDHLYMDAVQAMTGSGGWPLNVFLTPDKKAFYGGTYFPPVRAHGRASWKEVLINVSQYYSQNREEVESQANQLMQHLVNASILPKPTETMDSQMESDKAEQDRLMFEKMMLQADKENGGFGSAPKFPSTFVIKFLLDYYGIYKNERALQQACLSLDKMAMGGIYDQIGGGFSRYSTDAYWIAPHFEKMLYDNALLIEVYSIAFSYTKNEFYKIIVNQTVNWLEREMMTADYAFFSAQDADSEGVEGKYYTWKTDALKDLLQEDFGLFQQYYQIKADGNWEHTNILYTNYDARERISGADALKIEAMNRKLFSIRNLRVKPLTDDKILLGWNALMNNALSLASLIFDNLRYLLLAQKNMDFLQNRMNNSDYLFFHTHKNNINKIPAYLDDLAYVAQALLRLNTATAQTNYLHQAKQLLSYIENHFSTEQEVLFNYSNRKYPNVSIVKKEIYDGAVPSSNAILCKVFHHMGYLYSNEQWTKCGDAMLKQVSHQIKTHPSSFGIWAGLLLNQGFEERQVTIIGAEAKTFITNMYNNKYYSNVLFAVSSADEEKVAALQGKYDEKGTRIFVCKNNACLSPFTSIEEAIAVIL